VLLLEFRPAVPIGSCSTDGDLGYDGVTPDHFVLAAAGVGSAEPAAPDGRVVLNFDFNVTSVPGTFEIDTACFSSTITTIHLIDNDFPPVDHGPLGTNEVIFEKSVITIEPCVCAVKGDLNNDGMSNPLDVVYMVNYVYLSADDFVEPPGWVCPYELGDTDCDGAISPVDVINLAILVYRGEDCLCDPCTINNKIWTSNCRE